MSFNFADVSTTGWIAVGALAALAVVLLVIVVGMNALSSYVAKKLTRG